MRQVELQGSGLLAMQCNQHGIINEFGKKGRQSVTIDAVFALYMDEKWEHRSLNIGA